MSPLHIQVYDSLKRKWETAYKVKAGDLPRTIIDQLDKNSYRILVIEVDPEDSCSKIYTVQESHEVDINQIPLLIWDEMIGDTPKVLKNGQSYETLIINPGASEAVSVRVIHRKER